MISPKNALISGLAATAAVLALAVPASASTVACRDNTCGDTGAGSNSTSNHSLGNVDARVGDLARVHASVDTNCNNLNGLIARADIDLRTDRKAAATDAQTAVERRTDLSNAKAADATARSTRDSAIAAANATYANSTKDAAATAARDTAITGANNVYANGGFANRVADAQKAYDKANEKCNADRRAENNDTALLARLRIDLGHCNTPTPTPVPLPAPVPTDTPAPAPVTNVPPAPIVVPGPTTVIVPPAQGNTEIVQAPSGAPTTGSVDPADRYIGS